MVKSKTFQMLVLKPNSNVDFKNIKNFQNAMIPLTEVSFRIYREINKCYCLNNLW